MFLMILGAISCNDDVQKYEQSYDFSKANILTFKNESEIFAYANTVKENKGDFISFDDLYKRLLRSLMMLKQKRSMQDF